MALCGLQQLQCKAVPMCPQCKMVSPAHPTRRTQPGAPNPGVSQARWESEVACAVCTQGLRSSSGQRSRVAQAYVQLPSWA